jgi:hypothetical protein
MAHIGARGIREQVRPILEINSILGAANVNAPVTEQAECLAAEIKQAAIALANVLVDGGEFIPSVDLTTPLRAAPD